MKTKSALIIATALLLSSCSSVRHTAATAPVDVTVATFTVADMDVQPTKITATTNWNYNPFKRVNVETVKNNTTAKMLQETGADVLVEPQYIIERRGFLRGGSVTVFGFPAKYSNFHKMTPEEAKIISDLEKLQPKKEKKRFLFF